MDSTEDNTDLNTLGDAIFSGVNEYQKIDLQLLFDYWHNPKLMCINKIREMHLELLELVQELGFLKTVEEARRELERDQREPRHEQDPEEVLPSNY
jgi:hypothetical protein